MSISAFAFVVFGFKLDSIEITKTVKKFNEDTGGPYMAEVFDYRAFILCDEGEVLYSNRLELNKKDSIRLDNYEELEGFEIYGGDIFGECVSRTEDLMRGNTYRLLDVNPPENMVRYGEKIGLTPRFYLVGDIS